MYERTIMKGLRCYLMAAQIFGSRAYTTDNTCMYARTRRSLTLRVHRHHVGGLMEWEDVQIAPKFTAFISADQSEWTRGGGTWSESTRPCSPDVKGIGCGGRGMWPISWSIAAIPPGQRTTVELIVSHAIISGERVSMDTHRKWREHPINCCVWMYMNMNINVCRFFFHNVHTYVPS